MVSSIFNRIIGSISIISSDFSSTCMNHSSIINIINSTFSSTFSSTFNSTFSSSTFTLVVVPLIVPLSAKVVEFTPM